MTHRTAPLGALLQAAVMADDHGKTKEPLPQRPRGPHPYRVRTAVRTEDTPARRELLTDYEDDASAVVLLASWIGAAA